MGSVSARIMKHCQKVDKTIQQESVYQDWEKDLNDPGIKIEILIVLV